MVNACTSVDPGTIKDIKENLIKNYTANAKVNRYWVNILMNKCLFDLDIHNGWEEIINAQTPETISAFARQLLNGGNKVEIVMTPQD